MQSVRDTQVLLGLSGWAAGGYDLPFTPTCCLQKGATVRSEVIQYLLVDLQDGSTKEIARALSRGAEPGAVWSDDGTRVAFAERIRTVE